MPHNREQQRAAGRARWAGTTPEERRLATAKARREHAVRRVVESFPELDESQLQRLRALLRPVGGGPDAA
jgi:hypothetical protein